MSNNLFSTNFVLVAAPLAADFNGGPQEFYDALVANLDIQSPTGTNFFVVGDIEPSSDVGPWLKSGSQWWVFSTSAGKYVPLDISASETKIVVTQQTNPGTPGDGDPNIWLQTQGSRVIAWRFWDGSQWRSGGGAPPNGTTALRPTDPVDLEQYFDTDISCLIHWERGAWRTVSGSPGDIKFVTSILLDTALTNNPGWNYVGEANQGLRGRLFGVASKDPGSNPTRAYTTDSGISSRAQGDIVGEETHVLTSTEIESHTHVVGTATALHSDNNAYFQRVDDGESPTVPTPRPPNYFEVKGESTIDGTKTGVMPTAGNGTILLTSRQFKLADQPNYTSAAAAHNTMSPTAFLWCLVKQ